MILLAGKDYERLRPVCSLSVEATTYYNRGEKPLRRPVGNQDSARDTIDHNGIDIAIDNAIEQAEQLGVARREPHRIGSDRRASVAHVAVGNSNRALIFLGETSRNQVFRKDRLVVRNVVVVRIPVNAVSLVEGNLVGDEGAVVHLIGMHTGRTPDIVRALRSSPVVVVDRIILPEKDNSRTAEQMPMKLGESLLIENCDEWQ